MAESDSTRRAKFRQRLAAREAVLIAGSFNALSARIVEDTGFEAVYLTGAGVTNMAFALPDMSFVGLHEMSEQTMRVREAVTLPVIVDADTGFGNALNVRQTVRTLERCGADAIQIEDQILPKKCGHFADKQVISANEMIGKIRSAIDARMDSNFQIIARTDAAAVYGIEEAIERARSYAEAGADVLFIEATERLEDIKRLPRILETPQVINIVIGGKTPTLPQSELAELGYGATLYANAALQSAVCGMQNALATLHRTGRLDEDPDIIAPFDERQRLVKKALFDQWSMDYGPSSE